MYSSVDPPHLSPVGFVYERVCMYVCMSTGYPDPQDLDNNDYVCMGVNVRILRAKES